MTVFDIDPETARKYLEELAQALAAGEGDKATAMIMDLSRKNNSLPLLNFLRECGYIKDEKTLTGFPGLKGVELLDVVNPVLIDVLQRNRSWIGLIAAMALVERWKHQEVQV